MPSLPERLELVRIARGAHDVLDVVEGDLLALIPDLGGSVGRVEPGLDIGQFLGSAGAIRRRQRQAFLQELELAPADGIDRHAIEGRGLFGAGDRPRAELGGQLGGEPFGIFGNEVGGDPGDPVGVFILADEINFDLGDEVRSLLRGADTQRRRFRHRRRPCGVCPRHRRFDVVAVLIAVLVTILGQAGRRPYEGQRSQGGKPHDRPRGWVRAPVGPEMPINHSLPPPAQISPSCAASPLYGLGLRL